MILNFTMSMATFMALINLSTAGLLAPAPLAVAAAPAQLAVAPIVAPAAIGYTKAVPQNIPPFASRVDINTRALAAPFIAAPLVAAPASAPIFSPPAAAPLIAPAPSAPLIAPAAAAPFIAAPGLIGSVYASSLTAPFAPYAAAAYSPAVLG